MIGVDWGTSSFRAFRLDALGTVLARRQAPLGILRVQAGRFAAALSGEIGAWLADGEDRVLLDVRCLGEEDLESVAAAVAGVM